ncbi:MAG: hypothetical protein HUJ31_12030 [Pseudomonadales bacterium]|nr:hypothetical protein [Pseudomonadales bacterium]
MRAIFVLALLMLPAGSMAAEYICSNDSMTRTISVEYETAAQPVPCKVRYDKPDEGGVQYPWSANNQVGYCEQKAAELADKLNSYGWNCERQEPKIGGMEASSDEGSESMEMDEPSDEEESGSMEMDDDSDQEESGAMDM